ncbi:MAG: 5'-methylthioadenosine/S-adenosylhomocysteine nucleosidase [Armatimonas sp.]
MKIFIVGGRQSATSIPGNFPIDSAAHELGYHAASRGHTLLVVSENHLAADYHFMQGVQEFVGEPSAQKVFVDVYYPEDKKPIPYIGVKNKNIHIDYLPHKRSPIDQYRQILTHSAALNDCDAVICLGGGLGTNLTGTIASQRGIPVMAISAFGGSAQDLYKTLKASYDAETQRLLANQWKSDSAENIIKSLEALARSVDFAIICPLKEEREAVIHALKAAGSQIEEVTKAGKTYWRTQCYSESGPPQSVVVSQLPAMGNVASALSTSEIITQWNPKAVLVVGIAGTMDDEVKPGDVVVGSAVLYNEMGKVKSGVFYPEPYMYPADALLYSQAQTFPEWKWVTPGDSQNGGGQKPNVYFGVIVAGETVMADKAQKIELAKMHRKLLAIEMESAGVSISVHDSKRLVRQLSIRGISDLANDEKDSSDRTQRWRNDAGAAAAEFAVHLMRHCRLLK